MKNPKSNQGLPAWARFDRAEAIRRMTREMGPLQGLLRDHVDYGLRLLHACSRRAEERLTHGLALMLYHQSLGQLDAVDELIRVGCFGPSEVLMRSYLESGLQLLYLIHRDDDRVSAAYLVAQMREQIRQIDIRLEGDLDSNVRSELLELRSGVKSHFKADYSMRSAARELEKLGGSSTRWYRAFGGPKSLREVARAVELELLYDILYARMSNNVHGGTALMALGTEPFTGQLGSFRPLRDLNSSYWPGLLQQNHDLSLLLATKMFVYFRSIEGFDDMITHFEKVGERRLRGSPLNHLIEQFTWRNSLFKTTMEEVRAALEKHRSEM